MDPEKIQARAAAIEALRDMGVQVEHIRIVEVRFNGGMPDVSFHVISGSRGQGGILFFGGELEKMIKQVLEEDGRGFI